VAFGQSDEFDQGAPRSVADIIGSRNMSKPVGPGSVGLSLRQVGAR